MKHSYRTGISFGLTSGIITTLGLMIGLYSSTNSKLVVIGGILTIAIADAFSDALGIHIAEESKQNHKKEIWEATVFTFFIKFFIAMTFLVPVLLFSLKIAILIGVLWGLFWLGVLSYCIARARRESAMPVILEHWLIALVVIIITHYVGNWVGQRFV